MVTQVYIRFRALIPLFALLLLTGCAVFRTEHAVKQRIRTEGLKTATLEQLVDSINSDAAHLQSLNATVDIDVSTGGAKKGRVTEYQQISGYVLLRKPGMLRVIGLFPVVRNRAFDMVSNGQNFELSVPPRNKFFIGSNQPVAKPTAQPLESLRPQHILDALLLKPIDPETERAVMEQDMETVRDPKSHKDVLQPNYVVIVIRNERGNWYLARKIVFSRDDLMPHEQQIFNTSGQLVTVGRYENFTNYSGIMFPEIIDIERPVEEYSIKMSIVKLRINEQIKDDQFVLTRPPGAQLVNLDTQSSSVQN